MEQNTTESTSATGSNEHLTSNHALNEEINVAQSTVTSLNENGGNDLQKINDKIDKWFEDLFSKLPLRLPQARHLNRLPLERDSIPGEVDTSLDNGNIQLMSTQSDGQLNGDIAEQSTHLDETETLSNSILVQELVNESVFVNTTPRPNNQQQHRNEFHLSNLSMDTTKSSIINHMKLKGVQDTSAVKLTCLIPRNRDPSTLSYMSYKIDVNDEIASTIQANDFWPSRSKLKKFVQKRAQTAEFSSIDPQNFQLPQHQPKIIRRSK